MKPKQFKELLTVKLAEDEIKKYSLQLAKTCGEKTAKEEEKARIAERINSELKLMKQAVDDLSTKVESGEENRLVECEERPMYDLGVIWVVRLDTWEKIRERPMTAEDRQARMFEDETGGLRSVIAEIDAEEEAQKEAGELAVVEGEPVQDDFTADRCDECKMIEGGHQPGCPNNPNSLHFKDYLAYAEAKKFKNPNSIARKMSITKLKDADIRAWKQQQAGNSAEPERSKTEKLPLVEAAIDR